MSLFSMFYCVILCPLPLYASETSRYFVFMAQDELNENEGKVEYW